MRGLIVAVLLVGAVILGVGFYLDWFGFRVNRDPDNKQVDLTFNVNRERIQQDASKIKEEVTRFGQRVQEGARDLAGKVGLNTVEGKVARIDGTTGLVTVTTADSKSVTLESAATTKIRRHDVDVNLNALMQGDEVVVRYRVENGRNIAESITAGPSAR
jgi:hypothetical protein